MNCTLNSRLLSACRRYPVLLYPILDQANILIQRLGFLAPACFIFRRQLARQLRLPLGLLTSLLGSPALTLPFFPPALLFFRKPLLLGFARSFLLRFSLALQFRQPKLFLAFRLLALHPNLFQPLLFFFKLPTRLLGLLFGSLLLLKRQSLLFFPAPLLLLIQRIETRHLLANERLVHDGRFDRHIVHGCQRPLSRRQDQASRQHHDQNPVQQRGQQDPHHMLPQEFHSVPSRPFRADRPPAPSDR